MSRAAVVLAMALCACGGGADGGGNGAGPAGRDSSVVGAGPAPAATPVTVVPVARGTLRVTVSGPGRTEALRLDKVRAPFTGTLVSLRVTDGDHVVVGQEIGDVVSRNSEAALQGARALLESAKTPQEREDAQRALELAQENLVKHPLRVPEAGVVVSHAASEGDLVNEGDEIVSLAALGSIVFIAQIVQSDLPKVKAGQRVALQMAADTASARGVVHAILPGASAESLSAPVRIDFSRATPDAIGLFGTAVITVGQHANVLVVPAAAVLTDDVYGTSRVALVTDSMTAHWVQVTPGIREGDRVEIESPALPVGAKVIVSGQVGLPESAPVEVRR